MSNLIKVQIEGSADNHGHLTVADFLERIEELLAALNGIDCIVGQTSRPTLNYRIVDARHSSPISLTLEPVIKKNVIIEGTDHIEKRNNRFFHELTAIRNAEPISPEIDELLLNHFRRLVEGVGTTFTTARVSNTNVSVELDQVFDTNVRRLLDEEDASYGGEEGMLDAVNLHGRQTCWIYPKIGAKKIRCDFLPGMRDLIRENLGKFVRIEGVKFFRPHSSYAFRISVKDLEPIDEDFAVSLGRLKGVAPQSTGELSAAEFVRKLRDEWE
ncbi:MAG TPA: hypothetical protein VGG34_04875 [Opitutaceae bacterium]|jgi:hypothetical protein